MIDQNFKQRIHEIESRLSEVDLKLSCINSIEIDLSRLDMNNYDESLKKLVEEVQGPEFDKLTEEIFSLFVELFRWYLVGSNGQRKSIKDIFEGKPNVLNFLLGFPRYVSDFIHTSEDDEWLDIGLVAALIEDGRGDFRDLWVSLGELYLKAREKGIDPDPHFVKVGSLQTHNFPLSSVIRRKTILDEFLESEHLRSITH